MTEPMRLPHGWLWERENPTHQWRGVFVRRIVVSALGVPDGYALEWLEQADVDGRTRRRAQSFRKLPETLCTPS